MVKNNVVEELDFTETNVRISQGRKGDPSDHSLFTTSKFDGMRNISHYVLSTVWWARSLESIGDICFFLMMLGCPEWLKMAMTAPLGPYV